MSSNKWMSALKLFLPSWNFFNDFAAVPRMEYQLIRDDAVKTEWKPLFTKHTTQSFARIFFNPSGNLELLEKSLIDRAVIELESQPDAFAKTETHSTLARMVRARISRSQEPNHCDRFCFRLVMSEPGIADEIAYTSEEFPLAKADA